MTTPVQHPASNSESRKRMTLAVDYAPIVRRAREYIAAEMDAASPAVVVSWCETNNGEVVELTLSDLMSVVYLASIAARGERP